MSDSTEIITEKQPVDTSIALFGEKEIHISEAESGKKGYKCRACGKELVAFKQRKNPHHRSYFAHYGGDTLEHEKCYKYNETLRHSFAKKELARTKKIAVPAVYKLDPSDPENYPMKIADRKVIVAHQVKLELTFYENDQGQLKWGRKFDASKMNTIIVPDVTFFNQQGQPFLFVEIEATHRCSDDKKAKLRRLGIDTVEVTLPNNRPLQEITKLFEITSHTIWLYNQLHESTQYHKPARRTGQQIPDISKLQRQLYMESASCRISQIGELIRAIERYHLSEQCLQAEATTSEKIAEVTRDIERHRGQWEELRQRIEWEFDDKQRKLGYVEKDLETRYHRKAKRLEETMVRVQDRTDEISVLRYQREYDQPPERKVREAIRREQQRGEDLPGVFRRRISHSKEDHRRLERQISESIREADEETERIGSDIIRDQERLENVVGYVEEQKQEVGAIEREIDNVEREIGRIQNLIDELTLGGEGLWSNLG